MQRENVLFVAGYLEQEVSFRILEEIDDASTISNSSSHSSSNSKSEEEVEAKEIVQLSLENVIEFKERSKKLKGKSR